jgi:phosphocarrier protein HPr
MISKDYTIASREGIHARPATALIRLTKKYKSVVSVRKGENVIRLNSMLNLLTLGAKGGDIITVLIEGDDEAEAAQAIDNFFTTELKDL